MESTFLNHIPCEKCGSRDNAGLYTDGHVFCFGCGHHTRARDGQTAPPAKLPVGGKKGFLKPGELLGLPERRISQATCTRYQYQTLKLGERTVHVAPYYNSDRRLVAQKIRELEPVKRFWSRGSFADALPFGSQAFDRTGKAVIVTEGEIDAMSLSQVLGKDTAVVSIACGAGAQIKKYFLSQAAYFRSFEAVCLAFDGDQQGCDAMQNAASILSASGGITTRYVETWLWPEKDANAMLLAGKVEQLVLTVSHALHNTYGKRVAGQ